MNTKEAVAERIIQICKERNMAINALANISGVSPSTIYSMLNEKSQNPGIVSIKKLCDGWEISLREFFDSDLFDGLEQESKKSPPSPPRGSILDSIFTIAGIFIFNFQLI